MQYRLKDGITIPSNGITASKSENMKGTAKQAIQYVAARLTASSGLSRFSSAASLGESGIDDGVLRQHRYQSVQIWDEEIASHTNLIAMVLGVRNTSVAHLLVQCTSGGILLLHRKEELWQAPKAHSVLSLLQ